jgi:hypothetical protein
MSKVADVQATNRHPDVSPPAGARDVSSENTDDRVRVFFGTLRNATAGPVDIAGFAVRRRQRRTAHQLVRTRPRT